MDERKRGGVYAKKVSVTWRFQQARLRCIQDDHCHSKQCLSEVPQRWLSCLPSREYVPSLFLMEGPRQATQSRSSQAGSPIKERNTESDQFSLISHTDSRSCFTSQNIQKNKPFNYIAYSPMVTQSQRVNKVRQARHPASELLLVGYEAVWRTHNITERCQVESRVDHLECF